MIIGKLTGSNTQDTSVYSDTDLQSVMKYIRSTFNTDSNIALPTERRQINVIPGTPLVLLDDNGRGLQLAIYHRNLDDNPYRNSCYIPSVHTCCNVGTESLKLLDGNRFDPGSMIDVDWRIMVPDDMILENGYIKVVKQWKDLARLASFLDMPAGKWYDIPFGDHAPVRCLIPIQGQAKSEGVYRNGLFITSRDSRIEVSKANVEYEHVVEFNPAVDKQQWQIDTIASIEAAIVAYERHIKIIREITNVVQSETK